jgi:hypothetical protein
MILFEAGSNTPPLGTDLRTCNVLRGLRPGSTINFLSNDDTPLLAAGFVINLLG